MKIKEITVGGSRTINLGNYNSIKVEGRCTVEIDDESELEKAREAATEEVLSQMKHAYERFVPPKKDPMKDMME
jgi:hypothetical protein